MKKLWGNKQHKQQYKAENVWSTKGLQENLTEQFKDDVTDNKGKWEGKQSSLITWLDTDIAQKWRGITQREEDEIHFLNP